MKNILLVILIMGLLILPLFACSAEEPAYVHVLDGLTVSIPEHAASHEYGGSDEVFINDVLNYHITGQYWSLPLVAAQNVSMLAGWLEAKPIFFAQECTIDRIAIYISTAGAGGTVTRLGIYNNGDNFYPGTLLLDGGTVGTDATGTKYVTVDQSLAPGWYWVTAVSDGSPVVVGGMSAFSPLGFTGAEFVVGNIYMGWLKTAQSAMVAGGFDAMFPEGASKEWSADTFLAELPVRVISYP